jgi:hypothetical protein
MNLTRLFAGSAVALSGVLAAFHTAPARNWITPEGMEVHRIQTHFDSVLAELSVRDVATLSSTQRATRAQLLETLRAYRDRRIFPHNYDFPGRAVPYFIDPKTGTLCAVAHLLASSGRRDIVDRVASMNNNVWVPELAGDTAFTSWLRASGLTLAEAARIQMPYVQPMSDSPVVRYPVVTYATEVAIAGSLVTSFWNGFGNGQGRRTTLNKIGMLSGLTAVGVGTGLLVRNRITDNPIDAFVGGISGLVGTVSVVMSGRAIRRHQAFIAAEREAARQRDVSLVPLVPVTGRSRAGMMLSLQF